MKVKKKANFFEVSCSVYLSYFLSLVFVIFCYFYSIYHSLQLCSGYFRHCLYAHLSVDDRFPPDATVEFILSNGPEKMKGEYYHLSVCLSVCH